ncbi:MAG: aldose epimerase family protein [Marmoricola sp.]
MESSGELFGDCAVGAVRRLRIGTEPGPVLEVLDLGATVHRLWVTGGDDVRRNLVLGHATPQEYLDSPDYIGATVGRYANRISEGRFPLDGEVIQVETNERGNTLHGGPVGFDKQLWHVLEHDEEHLTLRLVSPDGDQGFPGELVATARFETLEDGIGLALTATTSAPTVVGLTSHTYFNLDGDGSGSIADQVLRVDASEYLPTDDADLPLDLAPVAGTAYDLRAGSRLQDLLTELGGLDHNYVLAGGDLQAVATVDSPATATRMVLLTDQVGLQVYTAGAFDGSTKSTQGVPYSSGAGVALEPQLFPDTPNRPEFGSAVLRPGTTSHWRVEWRFGPLG